MQKVDPENNFFFFTSFMFIVRVICSTLYSSTISPSFFLSSFQSIIERNYF